MCEKGDSNVRKNLMIEMLKKNISEKEIAKVISKSTRTFKDKLKGKYDFYFSEMLAIQEKFFPEFKMEFLFKEEK